MKNLYSQSTRKTACSSRQQVAFVTGATAHGNVVSINGSVSPSFAVPPSSVTGFKRAAEIKRSTCRCAAVSTKLSTIASTAHDEKRPLKVLIAGAGIGGLVLAVALIKKGFQVQIFERDLTAIRGEGKYRGPIQIQSNALGALEAIDPIVADRIMQEGCITGDRINGLCDGVTGDWYVKFDTFHPAVDAGLPVTRVISRVSLQNVLAKAVMEYSGPETILGNSHVVSYAEHSDPVTGASRGVSVMLDDGREFSGDVLVGADGIWSKIRKQMVGESNPSYSEYTCYTGISDFTPADIDIVGYRVFLGSAQYFVSSDVGGGKMQWYGFHKEPAGGTDPEGQRKSRLLEIFGGWSDNVVDLIKATPEEDILRRDIFDRPPVFKWSEGRTVLLGDSVHAMQPNLGQGGCMAIEDAYELANNLEDAMRSAGGDANRLDFGATFWRYQANRMLRASTIHGMAGMAAFMASTYKAYLGDTMPGPLANLSKLKIPHPGRMVGQAVMKVTMPAVLGWVLGGNVDNIDKSRAAHCRIADQPHGFSERSFPLFMANDEALIKAARADWLLITEREPSLSLGGSSGSLVGSDASRIDADADVTSTSEAKGVYISDTETIIGSGSGAVQLLIKDTTVLPRHARVWRSKSTGSSSSTGEAAYEYHVQDLGSDSGTWLNGRRMGRGSSTKLKPGDMLEFGRSPSNEVYKVKLQHVSLRNTELSGIAFSTLTVGSRRSGALQGSGDRSPKEAMAMV